MLKRLLSLGAATVTALISACEDGPATVAGTWRSPATWSTMVYASSAGPLLVEIHGDPFRLPPAEFRAQVAAAMTNQVMGRPMALTADAQAAPHPQFRVVLAFNPPDNADASQLCEGRVATATEGREKITVLAAFCDRDRPLASVRGWVAKVDGPTDKRFRRLLGQLMRELFGNPV
jgi:hypothetical protein